MHPEFTDKDTRALADFEKIAKNRERATQARTEPFNIKKVPDDTQLQGERERIYEEIEDAKVVSLRTLSRNDYLKLLTSSSCWGFNFIVFSLPQSSL